jgi:hypothetical protein
MDSSKEFTTFLETTQMDPIQAIATVLQQDSWGGPDELALFSKLKEVEFVIISEQTKSIVSRIRSPDSAKYSQRVYLYWCGVKQKENDLKTKITNPLRRMVHYNYFADHNGNSLFDETKYTDKQIIDAIEQSLGKVKQLVEQPVIEKSFTKLSLQQEEPPHPLSVTTNGKYLLIECPICKTVTRYQLPPSP